MTLTELADKMEKLHAEASPPPWYWGNGYNADLKANEEDGQAVKYADCQLFSGTGLDSDVEVIPIRVDHYQPIWDIPWDNATPHKADRDLISESRNALPLLVAALRELVEWREPGCYATEEARNITDRELAKLEER